MSEASEKLEIIAEMAFEALKPKDTLTVGAFEALYRIYEIATGKEEIPVIHVPLRENLQHVILSCDASIKVNPGGPAAVGFVIEYKDKTPIILGSTVPSKSNNQAEYDAIYEALTTFFNMHNNPGCKVEVRSDSKLVIEQLKGKMKCNDPQLQRRRDLILELVNRLPVPIKWTWRPRNCNAAMTAANNKAQDLINVRRH